MGAFLTLDALYQNQSNVLLSSCGCGGDKKEGKLLEALALIALLAALGIISLPGRRRRRSLDALPEPSSVGVADSLLDILWSGT